MLPNLETQPVKHINNTGWTICECQREEWGKEIILAAPKSDLRLEFKI